MLDEQTQKANIRELAVSAFNARDWPETISKFTSLKAISEAPSDRVNALLYLSRAFKATHRLPELRQALAEAYKLQPRKAIVLKLNAERAFADADYQSAARLWRELLTKKGPAAYARIFAQLAASLRKSGDIDAALATATEGLSRYPSDRGLKEEFGLLERMTFENSQAGVTLPVASQGKNHPYKNLPRHSFWMKTATGDNLEITNWYQKKFPITGLSIATAGSCFAQHIGRRLRKGGFDFIDAEPAPSFLAEESHNDYGYGTYSARYGNVYTSRQLLQLVKRAFGQFRPVDGYWEQRGGVVDPFRPTIEPTPFSDVFELESSRKHHLESVVELIKKTDLFVFTFGLTETWISRVDGAAFPVAPGVSGGIFNPEQYAFLNLSYQEVLQDMREVMAITRSVRPNLRFLLTVSPVPLMATATSENVIVASSYSKSVLRAVAGQLSSEDSLVDYFPSYEIISSHVMKGRFFEKDERSVALTGVDHVMAQFFDQHKPWKRVTETKVASVDPDEIFCDEELLRAFE